MKKMYLFRYYHPYFSEKGHIVCIRATSRRVANSDYKAFFPELGHYICKRYFIDCTEL